MFRYLARSGDRLHLHRHHDVRGRCHRLDNVLACNRVHTLYGEMLTGARINIGCRMIDQCPHDHDVLNVDPNGRTFSRSVRGTDATFEFADIHADCQHKLSNMPML